MGRVISLKQSKKQRGIRPKEFSPEEEVLVSELHRKIVAAAKDYHEIIVCKAIAVYMGDVMVKTEIPGEVIGGFMKHIEAVANIAIAQHKRMEKMNAPKVYGTKDPEPDAQGQPGASDAQASQGGDRDLEEEQQVLLPPTLQ